jgi:hypothetical protein
VLGVARTVTDWCRLLHTRPPPLAVRWTAQVASQGDRLTPGLTAECRATWCHNALEATTANEHHWHSMNEESDWVSDVRSLSSWSSSDSRAENAGSIPVTLS